MDGRKKKTRRFGWVSTGIGLVGLGILLGSGCMSAVKDNLSEPVHIPFVKNSSNECYYLDEFMPMPDGLVTGRYGSLYLRYYTYKYASYKDWDRQHVMLSFYSENEKCWSLFEEYYVR